MGLDITTYGASKKRIDSVASGFDHAEQTGDNTFSIFFVDGGKIDLAIPLPSDGKDGADGKDGISIVDVRQTDNTHFVCVLSDGTETQEVQMPSGGSGSVEISKKANNQIKQETDGLFVAPTDVSGKVDKEDGKSLVSNTDIAQIGINKADLELLMADEETLNSIRNLIKRAVEGTLHLTKEVIDHKPTVEEAKDEVLYLVPTDKEGVYKQYTKVGNAIVDLDNTEIDLSGYVQKDGDKVLSDNNYTDEDKAEVDKVKDKADLSVVESSQGRNLLPYPYLDTSKTVNGMTFTINDKDGSVKVNGTTTSLTNWFFFDNRKTNEECILKKGGTYTISSTSNMPNSFYVGFRTYNNEKTMVDDCLIKADSNKSTITLSQDFEYCSVFFTIANGVTVDNLVVYPMLEEGSIAHSYEPTVESNVSIIKQEKLSQGRNLIEYPYFEGTTKTLNGVTYTINSDGSVSVSGTPTVSTPFYLTNMSLFKKGTYVLSGCPSGGTDEKYFVYVQNADDSFKSIGRDYGEGFVFTLSEDTRLRIGCYVVSGETFNNLTFYPQLEKGSIAHAYEPTSENNVTLKTLVDNKIEKSTIIFCAYDGGKWQGDTIVSGFTSETTIQDVITYLNTNKIKSQKVSILANSNVTTFNKSLGSANASIIEIVGNYYSLVVGNWNRCYIQQTVCTDSKRFIATVDNTTVSSWKEVTYKS